MKLELISFARCPFVHRSTTMLHEKGVRFDIKYIDLKAKPPWFLAISPRGKVPVLVADGTPIFESAVINEFLDETHPPRLLPEDPLARARERAWIEVANDLLAAQYKLVSAATKEDFEAARPGLDAVLGRFEEAIGGPFFAGERFGLVDIAAAPTLYRAAILERRAGLGLEAAFPKVQAWAQRVASRESVRKGVVSDFESIYVESALERGAYVLQANLRSTSA
jgi:glutathione S-transferase